MTRDPGLQPERTRLAWRRTSLAMAAVTVLTIRLALTREEPTGGDPVGSGLTGNELAVLVAAAAAGWIAVTAVTFARTAGRPLGEARYGPALPLVALATVGYAGLGVILILDALG